MARHASHRALVAETLARVIQRADEPAEFLAIYWKDGKIPVAHQVRAGLSAALYKFNEYELAKYRGEKDTVKLRDVFRIVHPQPRNDEESALWKRVIQNELTTPDTWEVALSANDGLDKVEKWTRLLNEERLGALALLRNLRNMQQAGVEDALVRAALEKMSVKWVLPFRFIAAARHAPTLEDALETKLFASIGPARLSGRSIVLVDVSGSMGATLSAKSDMTRLDAACGVAMVARQMCEKVEVYTFSNELVQVPARRGFALRDAIVNSQPHGGTELGKALTNLFQKTKSMEAVRLIVITDEQSHDKVPAPQGPGYVINVASAKNGVGYGPWTHIDGFSEAVFNYIRAVEE
jgi:60 kDa SS-A/Ro ribonucleoprotein